VYVQLPNIGFGETGLHFVCSAIDGFPSTFAIHRSAANDMENQTGHFQFEGGKPSVNLLACIKFDVGVVRPGFQQPKP
jgi:hypothetical protein